MSLHLVTPSPCHLVVLPIRGVKHLQHLVTTFGRRSGDRPAPRSSAVAPPPATAPAPAPPSPWTLWTLPQRRAMLVILGAVCVLLTVRCVLNPRFISDPRPTRRAGSTSWPTASTRTRRPGTTWRPSPTSARSAPRRSSPSATRARRVHRPGLPILRRFDARAGHRLRDGDEAQAVPALPAAGHAAVTVARPSGWPQGWHGPLRGWYASGPIILTPF